jgi:glycosyltransferase involved in cell wall biosynthesis
MALIVSVVVPCYNEAGNIPLIIERFSAVIENCPDLEVVLVNNGSSDDSASVIQQQLEQCEPLLRDHFVIVNVPVNKGYGYGIMQGLHAASGDVLSWTHADMQTDPADINVAYQKIAASDYSCCLIKGKRKNRNIMDELFTSGMQLFVAVTLGVNINDINAQPKMFHRSFYDKYLKEDAPDDFSLDLYLLYMAKINGYKILEIPVYFAKRLHGEAKGGGSWKTKFKLIQRTVKYILKLKEHKQISG